MNFLENIFERLSRTPEQPVLQEVREGQIVAVTGRQMSESIQTARAYLKTAGLKKGDRCVLLAHNSIRWAVLDLALMAEGIVVVPLYARQAARELVAMIQDCLPALILCGDATLRDSILQNWPAAPRIVLFEEILGSNPSPSAAMTADMPPQPRQYEDPMTIIYTSGTSGEAKGAVLTTANLNHMLRCTTERLNQLMGPRAEPERVFHYLPFCFAGSRIALLSCFSRNCVLTLSTDLTRLAEEMRLAAPEYFLNVPALLERIRSGIDDQMNRKGGIGQWLYSAAKAAWFRRHAGESAALDFLRLATAQALLFPAIKRKLGPNLKALICGSAPLAQETQLFFAMVGVPVLQVYGLTETTAICTMDNPQRIEPGYVGPAIPGIEMKLGEQDEILVRGPNVFPGYWNRPQETAEVLQDGWFHTGDQGEVSGSGNWRITGRIKNLIVLNSGHNVAPEPIEDLLLRSLPGAQQVFLVGNARSYPIALLTGSVTSTAVEAALDSLNRQLPHYKRVHGFYICPEVFSVENGLLTANGKLRREAIAARYCEEIEALYRKQVA